MLPLSLARLGFSCRYHAVIASGKGVQGKIGMWSQHDARISWMLCYLACGYKSKKVVQPVRILEIKNAMNFKQNLNSQLKDPTLVAVALIAGWVCSTA
jgi:hypothetical protein